jgi:hypothetical protein
VTISAEFNGTGIDFPGERLGFMIKECELSGGFLTSEKEGEVISIVIEPDFRHIKHIKRRYRLFFRE